MGLMSSIRTGMTTSPLLTARSTSRLICGDPLACEEKTSSITRAWSIASINAEPHSIPGRMSRGAIQQRMPRDSSFAQTASAYGLSRAE